MSFCLGIFDSGVGGFTVLKRVFERHGELPCLYLADSQRVPYGEKLPSEIRVIAEEVVNWLCDQNASVILVACNTTNSLALDVVKRIANVPVIGLIDSAAEMIKEDRVGILATPATARSYAYSKNIEAKRPGTFVIEQGCPDLVPIIESGNLNTDHLRKVLLKYITPLLSAQVEAVILGCSHYPLLEPLLRELLPQEIRLIDPAIGLAYQLDGLLGSPVVSASNTLELVNTRICATSDPLGFADRATPWLGKRHQVELVSLRSRACFF